MNAAFRSSAAGADADARELFDAVVYGEMGAHLWSAGSEYHHRSVERTELAARDSESVVPESGEALSDFVQVVAVYHEDGRIQVFRNGKLYIPAYTKGPVITFAPLHTGVLYSTYS